LHYKALSYKLLYLSHIFYYVILAPLKIKTNPLLPQQILATNFAGLELISVIEDVDAYQECSWEFMEADNNMYQGTFFSRTTSQQCGNFSTTSYRQICVQKNNNEIHTAVAILPMIDEDISYVIICMVNETYIGYKDNITLKMSGIGSSINMFMYIRKEVVIY